MNHRLVDASGVIGLLRRKQDEIGDAHLAVVRMSQSDPRVDWSSFPAPSCALPGAEIGQDVDLRYSITEGEGLHLQTFRTAHGYVIEAHLDQPDGCRSPLRHTARATRAVEFGVLASVGVGLLVYVLTGNSKITLAAATVAAAGGAFAGANTPKQRRVCFDLATLVGPSHGGSPRGA